MVVVQGERRGNLCGGVLLIMARNTVRYCKVQRSAKSCIQGNEPPCLCSTVVRASEVKA
jgi:hypothetical protein